MSSDSIENIKIDALRKQTENYRIKSYVMFLILLGIILLVLIFIGRLGNDLFGLLIFLLIFSIPMLILFRNKLPNIMPEFITNSLYEIDETKEDVQPVYNVSTKTKQNAYLFAFIVLIIGSIMFIADYRNQLEDRSSFLKIVGSLVCIIFAGIILSNITGEELSFSTLDRESDP